MALCGSYYYTSKKEIKPQPAGIAELTARNYYTSKKEIKPQQ